MEASERLEEISKPRARKLLSVDTYYHGIPISGAALKYSATARIEELATLPQRLILKHHS